MDTPIHDELAAELTAELAGQGFWPDYFAIWVVGALVAEQLAAALGHAVADVMAITLGS